MGTLLLILIPVVVAILTAFVVFKEFEMLLKNQRQEYKLMSVAVSFMVGLFAGVGAIAFL